MRWFISYSPITALVALLAAPVSSHTALSQTSARARQLNIVASTTDIAAITREVGGDKVSVESIAKGYEDPHSFNVTDEPGVVLKLQQADLVVVVGRFLEIRWLPALITQSQNPKIQEGAPGYLDASQFAEIIKPPEDATSHSDGNPHYWLDPDNGRRIAQGIVNKLVEMDPADASYFHERFKDFDKRLTEAEKKWDAEMQPYRGRKIAFLHPSFTYFANHFGLDVVGYLAPRPYLPEGDMSELIQVIKREHCKVVLVEPYYDDVMPLPSIAHATGAQVLVYLPSVGGEEQVTNYFELFDHDISLLTKAFEGVVAQAANAEKKPPEKFIVAILDVTRPDNPCDYPGYETQGCISVTSLVRM